MFRLVSAGFPEGVGEEDGQRSGSQALRQGADREQPRRLVLGQGSDAGAEHPLGDGVQPVGVQAGAPGAGAVSGTAARTWSSQNRRRVRVTPD